MADSLWPHGLQYARPSCPPPFPGICPSSYPLNQWCHSTTSSSVTLLSFCFQSFSASESFPRSLLLIASGQSIEASASVLPMSIHGWLHLGFTGLISFLSKKAGKTTRPFSSVQFSCSVVCDSLWPHESQHARPPCPSPTPRVHSDSRPMSQWCIQVSHPL